MDYQKIYTLQDKVMSFVFTLENDFYLTGGTALHRFYYGGRYSDDLDFFVTDGVQFSEDVRDVVNALKKEKFQISQKVKARDFYRIVVDELLQVDFVNDRVYRHKKSKIIKGYRIDNTINILTNKINAIVSRDEEKDIFDLFTLSFNEAFNWGEVLDIANKKAVVEKDIFIYRVKNFPLSWLERIKKIEDISICQSHIERLCEDIMFDRNNSLKEKMVGTPLKAPFLMIKKVL